MKCLVVIALIAVIPSSMACRCALWAPEKYFCSNDFMIRAKVTGSKEVIEPGDTCTGKDFPCFRAVWYNLEVLEVYKAKPSAKKLLENKPKIFANSVGAQCGVHFAKGDEYIIAGGAKDNRLQAYACGYHQSVQNFKWLDKKHNEFFDQKKYLTTKCDDKDNEGLDS